MIFETHHISPPLNNYIESIFYFKDLINKHSIERVVPTGNIFLLFELDGFERNTYDYNLKPNGSYRESWVSGMQQKYLNISEHQNAEMLVIQFMSAGAYPFFKLELSELNNKIEHTTLYFNKEILSIRERLMTEKNIPDKFTLIETWLLEIFDERKVPPKEINEYVFKMQNAPFSKHNDLFTDYTKTKKNLIAQFKKYCGLTPKSLHRIYRFNKILEIINKKKEIKWTDIVYETGYTDQSHFIKEFQEFCGFNPSEYIKKGFNNSTTNFFPID